jgi:hypothetical protein
MGAVRRKPVKPLRMAFTVTVIYIREVFLFLSITIPV